MSFLEFFLTALLVVILLAAMLAYPYFAGKSRTDEAEEREKKSDALRTKEPTQE
tara:strand:- start:7926 stop:8087 length:162 start_codon:yes stop_codon:yes gene_type:complete